MTHDPREALDSLLAFRHGDTKHLTAEHARILYEALTASPGEQKPVAWRYRWKIDGEWTSWRVANASQKSRHLLSLEEAPLYLSPPPAAGCPDWGQIVQSLLRSMDATVKNEGSRDQAVRMADDLCSKYPALRREAPAPEGVKLIDPIDSVGARGARKQAAETHASMMPRPDAGGGVREAFVSVLASLAAAISLLERMPKAKKAAPSDTMFAIMLDDYRKALETGRAALSNPPAAVEKEADDWRDDPSADERWNAGLDFAMGQFCAALGVDPKSVRWDAATETLDGDVNAVIWNILRARFGEDWDPAAGESNASVEARLREALERIWQFGADTLSGRADGGPDDRQWQRDAVREMTRSARLALSTDSNAECQGEKV